MQSLLDFMREKRSEYHSQVNEMRKSLDKEMDQKLPKNLDIYMTDSDAEEGESTSLLDILNVLRKRVVVPVSMKQDFESLDKVLSALEVRVRVGEDDRREALKDLNVKIDKLTQKTAKELGDAVDFNELRIVAIKVGKLDKGQEKKLLEVMEKEGFPVTESHQGQFYRFVGRLHDKRGLKSLSHVVFSKLEGKVTDDRNFISNISTSTVGVKTFLEGKHYFL